MIDELYAGDKLLDAWLNLTSTLWNRRLVSSLTYHEAHIMGLLLRRKDDATPPTATDLIARTHLLKSQMNKVLTTLERKGYLTRTRSQSDRRLFYLRLTPEGETAYRQEHQNIERILSRLIEQLGTERALSAAQELAAITDTLQDILPTE